MHRLIVASLLAAGALLRTPFAAESQAPLDLSPKPDEQQLPRAMRAPMDEGPRISVGRANADILGADNRALQAAVDYIAQLGGGTVEIGPGEFLMHDSLHLRSNVTVRGQKEKTILRKAPGRVSPLALDGDYGEEQITLVEPAGFMVGAGVAIWDSRSGGFHTTVARIIGRRGAHTFAISAPLQSDCMVANKAQAATVFPVVSACNVEGVRIENLTVDGNRAENVALNGCRGAGIYLFRAHGAAIHGCTVRRFNGDGISFQACNDVSLEHCVSEDNAALGIHPGSGSQRPIVRHCTARGNGTDGLFLCWRVRHGRFEDNLLEDNGQFGISIGHKDSDNLLRRNTIRRNRSAGVFFRTETLGMAPHRNRLEENLIEDNGTSKTPAAGIRIRGEAYGLIFKGNTIRDSRPESARTQTVGLLIEETVGEVLLDNNTIEAAVPIEDRRKSAAQPK